MITTKATGRGRRRVRALEAARRAGRRVLLGVGLALFASSCGAIRFNRAWSRHASSHEPSGAPGGMEGRWAGAWRSEWNGHSGGLRCLMTRADEGGWRADFFSTYARILYFRYETIFRIVDQQDGTLRFEGEQDLGKAIGGLYRYQGTVAGDTFQATFRAENGDHGVFEMQRVE